MKIWFNYLFSASLSLGTYFWYSSSVILPQGRKWLPKTGWASSNAAPSILPKPGWAIAHPAHPPLTPLPMKDLAFCVQNKVNYMYSDLIYL